MSGSSRTGNRDRLIRPNSTSDRLIIAANTGRFMLMSERTIADYELKIKNWEIKNWSAVSCAFGGRGDGAQDLSQFKCLVGKRGKLRQRDYLALVQHAETEMRFASLLQRNRDFTKKIGSALR